MSDLLHRYEMHEGVPGVPGLVRVRAVYGEEAYNLQRLKRLRDNIITGAIATMRFYRAMERKTNEALCEIDTLVRAAKIKVLGVHTRGDLQPFDRLPNYLMSQQQANFLQRDLQRQAASQSPLGGLLGGLGGALFSPRVFVNDRDCV